MTSPTHNPRTIDPAVARRELGALIAHAQSRAAAEHGLHAAHLALIMLVLRALMALFPPPPSDSPAGTRPPAPATAMPARARPVAFRPASRARASGIARSPAGSNLQRRAGAAPPLMPRHGPCPA